MKLSEISEKMVVAYVPNHANNDYFHKDVEFGTVSNKNDKYVFVKFEKQLKKFSWEGTTSKTCYPNNLVNVLEVYAAGYLKQFNSDFMKYGK